MSAPSARARATAIAAAAAGLLLAAAVIAHFNVRAVLDAIRPIGAGGFLAVIGVQIALFVPLGLAWWLVALDAPKRIPLFMWGRLMREAASDVLPFSQLGGLVIAARAVVLGGVATPAAFGSSVVDITAEVVAQMIYTLAGVGLLASRLGGKAAHDRLTVSILIGLAVAAILVAGFVAVQRRGLDAIGRMVSRMVPTAAHHTSAVVQAVEAAYAQPARLGACLALHVAGWFGGAVGAWLILIFIDHPLPFLSVVAIESLLFAIRNAAFVAPSGIGVQEGAYALLGPLFGLPPEAALALSLLKRARDIVIGAPMLLSWQAMEARRSSRGA